MTSSRPDVNPAASDTVAIAIPCLAPAPQLGALLAEVGRVLKYFAIPANLVLVDSGGSSSDLASIASQNGATVLRQRGVGYGGAIRTAIEDIDTDFLITLDADGAHPPALLPYLFRLRHQAAIVVASRYVSQGFTRMPLVRTVFSRLLNAVFRRLLDLPVHDLSSSFRLYDRRVVASLAPQMTSYAALQEILIKAYCQGHRVTEVPMHYVPPAEAQTRARTWRVGVDYVRTLRAMWRLRNSTESCDYDTRAFFSNIPLQRFWQRRRYSIITRYVGGALRALDAGCGSTQMLNGLPQVIGMDPLLRKLRFMRAPGRRLVQGSTFELPFKSGVFDVVISSQVIEHLPEDPRIFEELVRCIAPGGALVLGTVDYGGWQWPLIERAYGIAKPTGYADEHITHYTTRSLLDRLNRMGLVVEDVQYILRGEIIIKARKPRAQTRDMVH